MSFAPRLAVCCGLVGLLSGCASGNGAFVDPTLNAPSRGPHGSTIVTSDDMDRTPTEPIEKTLASKVPGLIISHAPDGSISIRIRGGSSIMGNNEPLIIIDGMQAFSGPGGNLAGLNPRDIASIEVFKDAADLAFYGLRGSNGVIVIKTKQASQ